MTADRESCRACLASFCGIGVSSAA